MQNLILALNKGGYPHTWLPWQDAVILKCKGLIAWEYGDKDFMFRGGISRITGLQSKIEISSIIALKTNFYYKGRTPTLSNRNLFRRDLYLCAYCGKKYSDNRLTKDHIVPVSRGGLNTWTNCVTACTRCNSYKDDMLLEECNMQLLYIPYTPDRAEGLILQNRSILHDQMKFLSDFLPDYSRSKQKST